MAFECGFVVAFRGRRAFYIAYPDMAPHHNLDEVIIMVTCERRCVLCPILRLCTYRERWTFAFEPVSIVAQALGPCRITCIQLAAGSKPLKQSGS